MLKKVLAKLINTLSKPFLGLGIDQKLPWLYRLYEKVYLNVQSDEVSITNIPLGIKLEYDKKDFGLGTYFNMGKQFEPEETGFVINNIKKGDTVFDIGANIGYFTTLFSKIVGESGQVFSFEPNPTAFKQLQRNLDLNNLKAKLYLNAVSEEVDFITIEESSNLGGSKIRLRESSEAQNNPVSIKTIVIDQFIEENNIKSVDFLKIDIEGSELMALKGARQSMRDGIIKQIMVEINPKTLEYFYCDWRDLAGLLLENYTLYKLTDTKKTIDKKVIENELKKHSYINLICVKK
jgi:FkbM family methyltransferase